MRLLILALLLSNLAWATPFRSSDGAFEFDAPTGSKDLRKADTKPSMTLLLMTPDKVLVMATYSKPIGEPPEKFLAAVKGHSVWTVVDTHMGKLGGRPAAIYYADSEFKVPGYKSITAVIMSPTQSYSLKIHFPKGKAADYEAWFKKLKWLST